MGFFSGPPKDFLLKSAMGIASYAMQLRMLGQLDPQLRNDALRKIRADGGPADLATLIAMAAEVVTDNDMGWYKRNVFLGMIHGSLVSVGMPADDARFIKRQIEVTSNLPSRRQTKHEPIISSGHSKADDGSENNVPIGAPMDHDAVMAHLSRADKWKAIGEHIANDCLENGLREGGIVRYSEIAEYIASRHKYNTSAVQLGFTARMQLFVESGEIISLNAEGGDIVFVHEKHADELLRNT